MTTTISVVIPAWNAARHVAETIASVVAQSRRPDELIVVDDGSTDDTATVVERELAGCPIPSRLIRQANGGVAVARNAGVLASHGALLTFVDADDLLLPGHLEAMAGLLERHQQAVAAFGDVQEFDEEGDREGTIRSKTLSRRRGIAVTPSGTPDAVLLGDGLTAALLLGNFITNTALMIRRDALVRAGLFDPTLPIGEDRDLYMRLSLLGPFVELERVTARQRRHPESVMATRNNLVWAETSLRLLAAFRDRHPDLVGSGAMHDAFQHARRSWARIALREAASGGVGELRRMAQRCRALGFIDRPDPRDWARGIRASLRPSAPRRRGVDIGAPLPRAGAR